MEGPVKIQHDDGISRGPSQASQSVQGTKADPSSRSSSAEGRGEDRVELSERARALLVASDSIDTLQQIRSDKVESLKQSIKNGDYYVPGQKIAERILGEGLFA